jgi:hypothetical protein
MIPAGRFGQPCCRIRCVKWATGGMLQRRVSVPLVFCRTGINKRDARSTFPSLEAGRVLETEIELVALCQSPDHQPSGRVPLHRSRLKAELQTLAERPTFAELHIFSAPGIAPFFCVCFRESICRFRQSFLKLRKRDYAIRKLQHT